MTDLDDVNDVETAMAYLKIDNRRQLIALTSGPTPKIGFIRRGNVYTFTREDLEEYVENHRVRAVKPHPMGLTASSARRVAGARS